MKVTKLQLLVLSIASVLLAGLVGSWLAGSALSAPAHGEVENFPADLSGRSVEFPSESGATIHGWFVPGRKGAGAIILMHGVRANRTSMLGRARLFSRAGYSVLLFDFQAHGESGGDKITFGFLESRDAHAAVKFLRGNLPGEKIGCLGVSMGGAAILLASPPLDIDAMVLEMVYPSIDEAIRNRLTMRLGNWAGGLTPLLSWQFRPRLGVDVDSLRPIDRVAELNVPKLFIVGAEDQHTTLEESRRMFDAASEPKDLWIVERAKHVDLFKAAESEYEQRTLNFFGRFLSRE